MQARIDENDAKTWLAYNETTSLIEHVVVDPILNALYIFLITPDINTPTTLNNAKIDENDVKTLLGYNETTGLVEALKCGDGGELLVLIS